MFFLSSKLPLLNFQAVQFFMAAMIRENMALKAEVRQLTNRIGRLEGAVALKKTDGAPDDIEFPIFTSMEAYLVIENHPKDMVSISKVDFHL